MIRKFLAGFILSVFVVSAAFFYLVLTLYFTVLNKNFYTSNEFVSYARGVVVSELPKYFNKNLPEGFSSEYLTGIAQKYVTADEIKPIISDFGNEFNDAIKVGGSHEFTIDLSVFSKKRSLIAEDFANHLVESLNTCRDSSVYVAENPRCIPSGVSKDDFVRQFKATFDRKLFSKVPDRFSFSLDLPSINNSGVFGLLNTVIYAYVAFLFILLILIGLIVLRPFVRVLKWIIFAILKSLILFGLAIYIPTILHIEIFSSIFSLIFGQIFEFVVVTIFVFLILFILTFVLDKKQNV